MSPQRNTLSPQSRTHTTLRFASYVGGGTGTAGAFLNGLPASASCLRLNDSWYAGYAIGESSAEFTITVSIAAAAVAAPGPAAASDSAPGSASHPPAAPAPPPPPPASAAEALSLSPAALVAVGAGGRVAAELLGDLGGYQATPDLSASMLFIPTPASGDGDAGDPLLWPLLPTSGVSLDGTEASLWEGGEGGVDGRGKAVLARTSEEERQAPPHARTGLAPPPPPTPAPRRAVQQAGHVVRRVPEPGERVPAAGGHVPGQPAGGRGGG